MSRRKSLSLPPEPTHLITDDEGAATKELVMEVLDRAQSGDESVVEDVRRLLERRTERFSVVLQSPLTALIESGCGTNILAREVALHEISSMKTDLEGPYPSALEKMLVDRVVTCWYFLMDAEKRYVSGLNQQGGMSFEFGNYHQRRLTATQKRYNAAVLTLANVRKMQLPDVTIQNQGQLNIASQQVNLSPGSGTDSCHGDLSEVDRSPGINSSGNNR